MRLREILVRGDFLTAQGILGTTGLVWFRGGLRLEDNTCLYAALRENERVRCLYVLDDNYLRGADIGAARVVFLLDALHELENQLQKHGGQLIVRLSSEVAPVVISVAKEVGAGRIYANTDYLPYPMARDRKVEELALAEELRFQTYDDVLLVDPATVLMDDDTPFTVFTPFKRSWETRLRTPARYDIAPLLHKLQQDQSFPFFPSSPLPTPTDYGLSTTQTLEKAGEVRAQARLAEFVSLGLPTYHQNRDFCADPNSTSRLSMHIKWGTISIRDCYRAARNLNGPGADKWIDELAWREFYYAITYHFPDNLTGPMLPAFRRFPWSDNKEHFEAWKEGMTGYPFVDAAMRQLNSIGWMHNRTRQVVASYLSKDLLINWQDGERYFMQQLMDGDWPSNNGGWQAVAGTFGSNMSKSARIFNPVLQREKYDPQSEYVRQWVPEYGTPRYPQPIVTHAVGQDDFMKAFATIADRSAGRPYADIGGDGNAKGDRNRGRERGGSKQRGLF